MNEEIKVTANVFENANGLISTIGGLFVLIGTVITTWKLVQRSERKKALSEARKVIKINNVQGDESLINQLDLLLGKVASMSDVMIKIQTDLSTLRNKELSYKSAFHRLRLMCDEFCSKSDFCKEKIATILNDLKLDNDK